MTWHESYDTKRRATPRRKAVWILAMLVLALLVTVTARTSAQPPAGQDGFVPMENVAQREQLPAAPLVMAAYAVAWLAVFGYLWSIWQRLGRVEADLAQVSRRIEVENRR